jgi:O-methyltransferase
MIPPKTRRLGLSDFVPEESAPLEFVARFHPKFQQLKLKIKSLQISTLLDDLRLLALAEMAKYATSSFEGELIELGVYKGGSAAAVAWYLSMSGIQRPFHLCDTFTGLPTPREWEYHGAQDFVDTTYKKVKYCLQTFLPEYPFRYHQGLFSETLPFIAQAKFCFAHVDADLYESVQESCEFLYPRMIRGGIIVFDDYGAPTCPGAKKAIDEFFADKLEKPCHIARCAYGVVIGTSHNHFKGIVLRKTLIPAILHFLKHTSWVVFEVVVRRILTLLTSPQVARFIVDPFSWVIGKKAKERKLDPS